jgi:hypothetical protein
MSRSGISVTLLISALFLNTVGAYNIGPVPLTFLSTVLFIASSILFLKRGKISAPLIAYIIIGYLILGVATLIFNNSIYGAPEMPLEASSPYFVYVFLRVLNLLGYISAIIAAYNLVLDGLLGKIVRAHIVIMVFVTLSAAYIYIAQIYGLWEPLRTRIGTGGQDYTAERVEFQYLFHRATGTFREPSHLAAWLATTLIFILPQANRFRTNLGKILLIGASLIIIILSGSLLGIISFVSGVIILTVYNKNYLKLNAVYILILFPVLIWVTNLFFGLDFISALIPRLEKLYYGGVSETNRGYIYDYFIKYPPSVIGQGIGNGALVFSGITQNQLVSAIINLFLNAWYDAGIIGLLSFISLLLWPFVIVIKKTGLKDPLIAGCFAAHVAWVVVYLGLLPELSAYQAVNMGIFFGYIKLKYNKKITKSVKKHQNNACYGGIRPLNKEVSSI